MIKEIIKQVKKLKKKINLFLIKNDNYYHKRKAANASVPFILKKLISKASLNNVD